MDNTIQDLCKILAGDSNVVFDMMVKPFLDTYTPGFLHPCPYVGNVVVTNLSIESPKSSSSYLLPRKYFYTQ